MSLKKRYRIEPRRLSHIKNLLEGYDGLTLMTTIEPKAGIFELVYTESMEKEVMEVMAGISPELGIEEIEACEA